MAIVNYSFQLVEMQKLLNEIGDKCLKADTANDVTNFSEINRLIGQMEARCENLSLWALEGFRKSVR